MASLADTFGISVTPKARTRGRFGPPAADLSKTELMILKCLQKPDERAKGHTIEDIQQTTRLSDPALFVALKKLRDDKYVIKREQIEPTDNRSVSFYSATLKGMGVDTSYVPDRIARFSDYFGLLFKR